MAYLRAKTMLNTDGEEVRYKIAGGKQRVSSMSYTYDIAEGNVADHHAVRVLGRRESIRGSQAWDEIHTMTSPNVPRPSSAVAMEVVSTNANDTSGGSGIQVVEITGLDATWAEKSELVVMNGTTPVATANEYVRINAFHGNEAGSLGVAGGDITLQSVGGATIYSEIEASETTALLCHYTIPNGYTGYLVGTTPGAAVQSNGSRTNIEIQIESNTDITDRSRVTAYQTQLTYILQDGTTRDNLLLPLEFPSMADVYARARKITGSDTSDVTCSIELWIEKD